LNHPAYEPADGRTSYFLQPNSGSAVKLSYGGATVFAANAPSLAAAGRQSLQGQTATGCEAPGKLRAPSLIK
jgi:hypothetical protein